MAKRTAERQLTQLNQHDDEDSDVQGSNFQKADEGELARRVIRKPKSRLRTAASNESTPKASFSGFAGFGASSSNVSEASGSEQPKSSFTGFSFGQAAPNVSEKDAPASGGAVKAGGFGSSGFGSSGFGSSGAAASATPAFGSSGAAASATPAFGSGGFGAKPSATTDKPASTGFSFGATPSTTDKPAGFSFGTQSSGFTFGKPAVAEPSKPTPSEPAKPAASGFSIGAFKPPTATAPSTASTGMFSKTSALPSFKSGFIPPTSANTVPAAAEPTKSASDDEFYRHIRGLNASIQKKITDAIAVNAFVDLTPLLEQYQKHWKKVTEDFMPDTNTAVDTAKPVVTASVVSKADAAPVVSKAAEPAPIKSSMFASLSPPTQPSKPAETKFAFGAQSTSSATSPPKPAETKFAFGTQSAISATSPKPAETKFAFGAQSTSSSTSPKPAQGSPGGFSFNFSKPAATTDAANKPFSFGFGKPSTASSPPKPAFSFGMSKPMQSPTDAGPPTATSATDAQSDDEQEPDTARAPTTAGEEGETTVHKVRGKVYMWDSEKKAFKDLGVGNLRINTWETDGGDKRARILCRQETTEKITLNASMFAKMMVEHKGNDKNVGLLAVVDAKPTRFMFRVKTTGEASELKKALDTVIASL
ncbi:hypothetical protein GGH96_000102 [Coemansia sp. RSA 1972]|nr:hypothetical protein GGH96_000102 [Coemansia sp. RSA 1972]